MFDIIKYCDIAGGNSLTGCKTYTQYLHVSDFWLLPDEHTKEWRIYHHIDNERVYLPLYKVADTPFHCQCGDILSSASVEKLIRAHQFSHHVEIAGIQFRN